MEMEMSSTVEVSAISNLLPCTLNETTKMLLKFEIRKEMVSYLETGCAQAQTRAVVVEPKIVKAVHVFC